MKNTSIFASAAMILATAAIASANPFSDVPASHWAYQAVNSMAEKGIIQGFPNGTFKGNQNVTRYQLAMITAKMIANVENCGGVSKTDLQTLEKLTVEFADELALLGVKVTALEDDMQVVKEDVAGLKKDVDGIKSYMKNGGMEKVKLSGDMLVRNFGSKIEADGNTVSKKHKTETLLRLQMDAQIDENITARARWNVIENKGANEWNGGNKNTGSVEVAYLQIKDMFGFGGDFKFGRDWYQHGHGFVMHNYADAISYAKRCGDVDLALNAFFKRQEGEDSRQVWNINADYSYKNHDMYLGVYTAHATEATMTGHAPQSLRINDDSRDCMWVEFGSHGPISNNNEKISYDVAAVYSNIEKGNQINGEDSDAKGWLAHVAVNYDSQKQLTAKVAYTMADEESCNVVNVENSNRWCDGDETIFEDLFLSSMTNNGNTNAPFCNLQDIKIQLGYTLKNADKHSFRLAYDNVQNKKDGKANTFAKADNRLAAYTNDLKSNIITFEYTYKLAENTRIRLGYQNSKTEGENGAGVALPDVKTNLYYTEIYSRF